MTSAVRGSTRSREIAKGRGIEGFDGSDVVGGFDGAGGVGGFDGVGGVDGVEGVDGGGAYGFCA